MTKQQPSGPKGLPFIGNLREFSGDDRIQRMQEWKDTYGDTVHLTLLGRDAYILSNPDDISQILVKEAKKVHKSPLLKRGLQVVLGEGLLLSEDDFHKRQRRLTQPAFHVQRIANYADTIVAYGERLTHQWHDDQQVDIHHDMMTVTMQIIAKVLFDADVSQDANNIGEAITVGIEAAMHKITNVFTLPLWVPTPFNRRTKAAFDLLEEVVGDMIDSRRQTMDDRGDLLSMLLLSEDENGERMTDKQVRDEAMTLFLAGHETTANALTWTFYLLAQHPDIRAKLLNEIDTVLGKRSATLDDLKHLTYTEMVIKESMRVYPPAWITTRIVVEPFELSQVRAEVDNLLIVSPYLMHHDSRYWEKPDTFYPEHFTPEAEKEREKFAYFPFGGGPRVCIGNHFAMMEAKLLLATFSQYYTADITPHTQVTPEPAITLRPRDGLLMRLQQRQPELA